MKKLFGILFVLFVIAAPAQAQVRLGTPVTIGWDYLAADITNGAVVRFEVRIDAAPAVERPAAAGTSTYQIPASLMTLGAHTARVRACSLTECSADITLAFTVDPTTPRPPSNLRLIIESQAVSVQEAVQITQAYAVLTLGRELSQNELMALANLFPGPMTRGGVRDFLDANYARLFP